VLGIEYVGIEEASPAPGLLEAIHMAEGIIIAPSNPLVSIEPILRVKGVRSAIRESKAKVVAISPIVGGRVIKGPLEKMFQGVGIEVSPVGIAEYYEGLIDALIVDDTDEAYVRTVQSKDIQCYAAQTIMDSAERKRGLASFVTDVIRQLD
jgi:LPPG:FO 2-phospho-L-lactate transferase